MSDRSNGYVGPVGATGLDKPNNTLAYTEPQITREIITGPTGVPMPNRPARSLPGYAYRVQVN